jgi:PAS domain S-box-containing protein
MKADPKEKEELYRILVENAMDALILCDEKLNLIYTSPSTERLFEYKKDELRGHNAFEFFHPEDISAHEARLKMLLKGKEFPSIEFRVKKKDGNYVWCDVSAKPIKTSNEDKRLVVVIREVHERKEMQEKLRNYSKKLEERGTLCDLELNKTKEYLEQLIGQLPLALVAWDKDCKIKTWNPKASQMFGFSEAEFLERSPEELFSLTRNPCPINRIWNQLLKDGQAIFVGENVTKDGEIIICNWTNILLRDEDSVPNGVLSMIQDITEQKKLEERLRDIAYSLSGVKAGQSYLISSVHQSLKIAFDLTSQKVKGLFIVREDPDSLVKNYNFKPEDIVLLSVRPIKEFTAVNNIQDVAINITKFLKNGGGVVVLSGLEYLISRFSFNSVFMMIQEKRFEFLEAGATFLVPINLDTLDIKEKSLLTSELKLIE